MVLFVDTGYQPYFCFAAYGSSFCCAATRGLSLFSVPLGHGLLFHLAAMGLGSMVYISSRLGGGARGAVGLGLGRWFGSFRGVQFFAAHLFIFGPQVAILLYFVGLASWAIVYQQDKKSLVVLGHAISRGCSKPWILLALVLAFVVVIGCATPPLFWDSNVYSSRATHAVFVMGRRRNFSAHHTFSANPLLELALSPVLILSFDPVHMNGAQYKPFFADGVSHLIHQTLFDRKKLQHCRHKLIGHAGGGLRRKCDEI